MTEAGPLRCFLFTDVEGSTRRWEADSREMDATLGNHDGIVRASIERYGGAVFSTGGDGFAAVFDDPSDAVLAAADAQKGLSNLAIKVRMGLHVGRALERDGDFFGPTVNRAARLMQAGHGGQVLLSDAAASLARPSMPEGIGLVDLGVHALRDLVQPERIWQLAMSGTTERYPRLATVDVARTNLRAVDDLVGRAVDVVEVSELLRRERVVTITGPGGVGKTRLAVAVASDMVGDHADGVWLVDLSTVGDPAELVPAVAAHLPLRSVAATVDELTTQMRSLEVLVVLDNCEHLVDAVADLVHAVVTSCGRARVLCTSREGLAIDPERLWLLRPLTVADGAELFRQRASAVRPNFAGDDTAVNEISARLDGLPLAIELAAARVRTLAPSEIASLLGDRFRLLSGGRRGKEPRHRTLQATVDWSYDQLNDAEQTLFRCLGIFAGGFTLDAAEAVALADGDRLGLVDHLDSLVHRSLLTVEAQDGGSTRFGMLESLRTYALDRLDDAAETAAVARRHASWCERFVTEFAVGVRTAEERRWLAAMAADFENVRAAIGYGMTERDVDLLMTLVGGLRRVAHLGRAEPMEWARELLHLPGAGRHPRIGEVHLTLARIAWMRGDLVTAAAAGELALESDLDENAWTDAQTSQAAVEGWRGARTMRRSPG